MLLKLFFVFMAFLIASALQGCAQLDGGIIDVKRMTYKALRQHDCRINEPNEFCGRGFSNEFEQYERLREQFLRDTQTADAQSSNGLNDSEPEILEIW